MGGPRPRAAPSPVHPLIPYQQTFGNPAAILGARYWSQGCYVSPPRKAPSCGLSAARVRGRRVVRALVGFWGGCAVSRYNADDKGCRLHRSVRSERSERSVGAVRAVRSVHSAWSVASPRPPRWARCARSAHASRPSAQRGIAAGSALVVAALATALYSGGARAAATSTALLYRLTSPTIDHRR